MFTDFYVFIYAWIYCIFVFLSPHGRSEAQNTPLQVLLPHQTRFHKFIIYLRIKSFYIRLSFVPLFSSLSIDSPTNKTRLHKFSAPSSRGPHRGQVLTRGRFKPRKHFPAIVASPPPPLLMTRLSTRCSLGQYISHRYLWR